MMLTELFENTYVEAIDSCGGAFDSWCGISICSKPSSNMVEYEMCLYRINFESGGR